MGGQDFLSVLEDLLRKVLVGQGIRPNNRTLYNPLRNTEFRHRKSRWFPDPMMRGAATQMPKEDFAVVRERLVQAMDGRGVPSLNASDINRLEQAWENYRSERATAVQVSERIPKYFEILAKDASDLTSCEGLSAFLYEKTYRLMLRGDSKECAKALWSIYAAFENGHERFGRSPATRAAQRELILLNSGFCLRRLSDETDIKYVNEMKRRLHSERSKAMLAGVLTHGYMTTSDPEIARAHVDLFKDSGKPNWWDHYHHGIDLIRAANIAVDLGFSLPDKPTFLGGFSVEDAFRKGLEAFSKKERLVELNVLTAISLAGVGASGDLDSALTGILQVRKQQGDLPDKVPQLEMLLLLAEARSFFAASRGAARNYLFMAGSKMREFQELRKQHPSLWVRPGSLKFVNDLRLASIEKLGTISHMGL